MKAKSEFVHNSLSYKKLLGFNQLISTSLNSVNQVTEEFYIYSSLKRVSLDLMDVGTWRCGPHPQCAKVGF